MLVLYLFIKMVKSKKLFKNHLVSFVNCKIICTKICKQDMRNLNLDLTMSMANPHFSYSIVT
jgi:hypothetical protein